MHQGIFVYSSQKDTRLSIMIAVVLLITMNTLSNREMFEGFSGSDCGNHLTREDCNADGHCMYDDNGMCVAADSMTNVSYEDLSWISCIIICLFNLYLSCTLFFFKALGGGI